MKATRWVDRALWGLCGAILATAASYFLFSSEPVSASTGDRSKDIIMCTGPMDVDGEGVFLLDTVTGDLRGWVMDTRSGNFLTAYATNVVEPLGVNLRSNPEFSMVTGGQLFKPRTGQNQHANMVLYVAESTTGTVAAFAVPWTTARRTNPTPMEASFQFLQKVSFRSQGAIRN